jgi:hypothetical protein
MRRSLVILVLICSSQLSYGDESEGGFQGYVDGDTYPTGAVYMVVNIFDDDEVLVGWTSSIRDPFRFYYGPCPVVDVHAGPFDLVCIAYDEDDVVVAENWVRNVEYTGQQYYQVVSFWWGPE